MPSHCSPAKLFLVATPIGNLDDFSHRAKVTLNQCDLIACEDTRVSSKLLSRYSIKKPLVSYREENEKKQASFLTNQIKQGKNIALLSDAGLPTISDPGFRLVRECHLSGIEVVPIPGPNAAITALCASGLPTHQFLFLGFLPKKKVAASKLLQKWSDFSGSIILYESRYKIIRTMGIFQDLFEEERYICIARELTKVHETILSGPMVEVFDRMNSGSTKGEFTIVIAPRGYSFEYSET